MALNLPADFDIDDDVVWWMYETWMKPGCETLPIHESKSDARRMQLKSRGASRQHSRSRKPPTKAPRSLSSSSMSLLKPGQPTSTSTLQPAQEYDVEVNSGGISRGQPVYEGSQIGALLP